VGRSDELARLREELDAAREGARVVLIAGEAGVGKTRLVGEFQTLARARARWLMGRGSPLGSAIPFSLVVEALESHLRGLPATEIAGLCGTRLAALREVLPSVGAALRADPAASPSRLATFEAFICLLEAIAKDRPLVLVLDDAHRADPSSWELLHYFARNPPRAPLLVLVTLRGESGERSAEVDAIVGLLLKDRLATELRLVPFDREDLGALATRTLGPGAAPATLTEWLYARTGGNALFATALLEDLAADPNRRDVPRSIRAHVEALTAELEPEGREVLGIAAVLGRSFSLRTIARLIPADAGRWLDDLVRRGVLNERTRDATVQYDFGHPLVQEVTYDALGAARRRELHEKLARTLSDETLAVRAYHAARGALRGDATATALIRDAAREAERAQAHREALQHLGAAIALIPTGSPERAEVLDEIGWQAAEAGEHDVGVEALRELLGVRVEPREQATVHMRLASLLSSGPGELVAAELEATEAVRLLESAGAEGQLAAALNELAWIRGEAGDLAAQVIGSRDALDRAEALGDETLTLHALGSTGYALSAMGQGDAAVEALQRGRAIAMKHGDLLQSAWHTGALGLAFLCAGRLEDATRTLDEALGSGPAPSAVPYAIRAFLNWFLGRWDLVLDDHRAVQALHPGSLPAFAAWTASLAGLVELAMRQDAAGERHLEQGGRVYAKSDFYWHGALHDWIVGSARALVGDLTTAQIRFVRAADRASRMGALVIEAIVLPDLAEVRADAGDLTGATEAATRVRLLAGSLATTLASAHASYAEGTVLLAGGRASDARPMLRSAAELAGSAGLRFLRARSLERLARASEGADHVRVSTEAARLYAAIGATRYEERVLAELRGLGAAGRRSAQAVGDLTAREKEVVALVRTGLGNREIAERLHLSERTVETHLAHIYSKLGVEGRRDLA
jgi:ATP/maltotriose-dependent transcriptional regulator MalT